MSLILLLMSSVPEDFNVFNHLADINFEALFYVHQAMPHLKIELLEKQIRPYDGSRESLAQFISSCESANKLCSPQNVSNLFELIKLKLTGRAFNLTRHRTFVDWPELKAFMEEVFSDKRSQGQWELELHSCRQSFNEDVLSYASRVENILQKLIDSVTLGQQDPAVRTANETLLKSQGRSVFILGLNSQIAIQVKSQNPKTLEEAISLAVSEEREFKSKNEILKYQKVTKQGSTKCGVCFKTGHITENCYFKSKNTAQTVNKVNANFNPSRGQNSNQFNRNISCAYCKLRGHHIRDCRKRKYNENIRNNVNSSSENLNQNQPSTSGEQEVQNLKVAQN